MDSVRLWRELSCPLWRRAGRSRRRWCWPAEAPRIPDCCGPFESNLDWMVTNCWLRKTRSSLELGAAHLAAEAPVTGFKGFLDSLRERVGAATTMNGAPVLPPLPPCPPDLQPETAENSPVMPGLVDAYLGLDVGSVSTNLVLLSPDNKVLAGIFLPTLGRPVEALHQGLSQIRERFGERLTVLGVGATGSGRHLAAKATGADVTHNEITAQMVSSLLFFPHLDTIFEIGDRTPSTSRCATAAWRILR
jgi:hypothetical protein